MSKPQLIIAGSIAFDRIMNYRGRFRDVIKPDKIHVLSLSILLDKIEDTRGGIGANIAYNLALLNEQPVLLGSVGPDASLYVEKLQQLGVNIDYLHFSEKQTATFNVFTDSDDNQIGGFYGGAMDDSGSLSLASWANKDALIVISPHHPPAMRRQVAEAQEHGLRLVYDISQQVANCPSEDLRAGLEAAELVIVNDYEAAMLTERSGYTQKDLISMLKVLVITRGKEGSDIYTGKNKPIKISAAITQAEQDPTGAGDAYRAGFLYGYVRDWGLKTCGQMGAVAASFAVEAHGTQKHAFTAETFKKRYNEYFNEEVQL